ncbi:hypothetical protein [Mesorhizobium sp. B4-1-4]|uniref:hypothetical protein n=1 Tax=Mesorhizobium sp. B4-1-4 TaxID=2589888 RepID=UPI001D01FA7A|nr:hypothetical protein [Mesorhizobium sp. B4-1-4]UCI32278.1 hypothetical protein FJW03_02140 [Mesorhizobium sp. B4-1-4]
MWRDFTYIDDIVEGGRVLAMPPHPDWDSRMVDPATSSASHRICKIGDDRPEEINA